MFIANKLLWHSGVEKLFLSDKNHPPSIRHLFVRKKLLRGRQNLLRDTPVINSWRREEVLLVGPIAPATKRCFAGV
jgi:hypothetical protein